ncbi:pyridoxamine 5'-phosphate oxidase family protein [Desulfovibrio mangrovi]|uniref:pyridoxamine 5'-phosphate oxidase family protein n=1 Tax=Desulfovibrio mangrovi TaxID=2976983 RepID=UPI002246E058|nr:pyridoxamine 5'-phosphate oxidase family protein [Desulfovibrio mangrovi]UZP69043.1 pyridoxamine 5'-phosphate oxidase family protein [Desulfovibrio mangrovi]
MRRKDRAVGCVQEMERILGEALYMTLATHDVEGAGAPYLVSLNYVYHDGNIYFHCAQEGKKLDCIRANASVAVSVVGTARLLVPENAKACDIGMAYESVVVRGKATILEQGEEHQSALAALVARFGGDPATIHEAAQRKTVIVRIKVEEMSGKRANLP